MIMKAAQMAMAIVVLSSVTPTLASAAELTGVGVGSSVTGTVHNFGVFTSIGNIECEEVVSHGEVTKNSGGEFIIQGKGVAEAFNCFSEGEPVSFTDFTLFSLRATSPSAGSKAMRFEVDLPVVGTCRYEASALPVTYTSGGETVHFEGPMTASPAACGQAEIEGETTLEHAGGGQVVID
jgi:hypothetical protein